MLRGVEDPVARCGRLPSGGKALDDARALDDEPACRVLVRQDGERLPDPGSHASSPHMATLGESAPAVLHIQGVATLGESAPAVLHIQGVATLGESAPAVLHIQGVATLGESAPAVLHIQGVATLGESAPAVLHIQGVATLGESAPAVLHIQGVVTLGESAPAVLHVQGVVALPLREVAGIAVPLGELELAVTVDKLGPEPRPKGPALLREPDRVQEVERQALQPADPAAIDVHVMSRRRPGSRSAAIPSRPAARSPACSR